MHTNTYKHVDKQAGTNTHTERQPREQTDHQLDGEESSIKPLLHLTDKAN